MDPFSYWVNTAHTKPEAVTLATRLNIDLPRGEMRGFKAGLMCV
jgi:hypothetical protein